MFDQNGRFVVIADGMGGHANGGDAAKLACEKILSLASSIDSISEVSKVLFNKWFSETNNELLNKIPGSGTTCSLLCVFPTEYFVASAGDSRIYLFRDGRLSQLTTDQNLATTTGTGLNAHILTNHIGKRGFSPPGFLSGALQNDDIFILASDGAYSENEDIIAEALGAGRSSASMANAIQTRLEQTDPKDNYTVAIVGVDFEKE